MVDLALSLSCRRFVLYWEKGGWGWGEGLGGGGGGGLRPAPIQPHGHGAARSVTQLS